MSPRQLVASFSKETSPRTTLSKLASSHLSIFLFYFLIFLYLYLYFFVFSKELSYKSHKISFLTPCFLSNFIFYPFRCVQRITFHMRYHMKYMPIFWMFEESYFMLIHERAKFMSGENDCEIRKDLDLNEIFWWVLQSAKLDYCHLLQWLALALYL